MCGFVEEAASLLTGDHCYNVKWHYAAQQYNIVYVARHQIISELAI